MSEPSGVPPELVDLDRALRGVRFDPRSSLGPEIEGRVRRGEHPEENARRRRFLRAVWGLTASVIAAVLVGSSVLSHRPVEIDRCCFDLDGGGTADDGVTLVADRDAKVHRLRLYEDRDHSGTFSPGDPIRLDRGDRPSIRREHTSPGLVTIEHCCVDFDGGGPSDDALVVMGVPPDRVVMAAIYERRPDHEGRRAANASPLR